MHQPERRGGSVMLAHCWAHIGRKFYEIVKGGLAPIAQAVLKRIGVLCAIEAKIRRRGADARPPAPLYVRPGRRPGLPS